jgi:putative alpha-1,2-mannosidase
VRAIVTGSFRPKRGVLPGNDDSGAVSSWYAFSAMGFFPNAGQDMYLIGSPLYPATTIRLANGKTFAVEAKNVSAENKYVLAAKLNGKPLDRAWFRHSDIMHVGSLVLTMAAKPGTWPKGQAPPSMSDSAFGKAK